MSTRPRSQTKWISPSPTSFTPFTPVRNGLLRRKTAAPPIVHEVLQSPGKPLDSATRAFMEPRFGHDFSQVRVHTDSKAAESAQAVNALAYTVGRDIVFGARQYMPQTAKGRRLFAHELTHTLQQGHTSSVARGLLKVSSPSSVIEYEANRVTENIMRDSDPNVQIAKDNFTKPTSPMKQKDGTSSAIQGFSIQRTPEMSNIIFRTIGEQYGQAIDNADFHLISDLTSPIAVGSEPSYEVRSNPGSSNSGTSYTWKVFERGTGRLRYQVRTDTPTIRIPASTAGHYIVQVIVHLSGGGTSILNLNQDVVAEDAFLTSSLTTGHTYDAATYRELINDFRTYIIDAANATGPNGITPRFLASVLKVEVSNRPKQGREDEIQDVRENLSTNTDWIGNPLNRSIGVGQIRLSTAAMTLDYTTWREQDRTDRDAAREGIDDDFDALTTREKWQIFKLLRWPKSNIDTAAQLLNRLKNRSHRYPGLTKAAFGTNNRAVRIIATEYNSGGTDTPEATAGWSSYGDWVWDSMSADPIIRHYFANT